MSKSQEEKNEENMPESEEALAEAEEETKLDESEAKAETEELPEEVKEETEEEKETIEETALGEETKEEAEEKEEEEEKPKKEELEEDIVEEKFYTIPLRRAWIMPPKQRAPRAMRIIKSFVEKHMKIGVTKEAEEETEEEKEERLIISAELNEKVWLRGIEKPPRRIKVRVVKDSEGNVTVYPAKGD